MIRTLVEHHLAHFLNEPTTCPHGHPIPRADGSLWQHDRAIDLIDLPLDVPAKVLEVKHEVPELLRYLGEIGLRPGVVVKLKKLERAIGLITIEVAGKKHTVSVPLASDVLVRDPVNAKARK